MTTKQTIHDKQLEIINNLRTKIAEAQAFSVSNTTENFTNMSSIILNNNSFPEVSDYANIYNKKVALLDDPNRMNSNAFNTFIYLQDKKIDTLRKELKILQYNIQSKNIKDKQMDIKAFKNMNNSQILNVEVYNSKNKNNSISTPNYLIYGNNGCLEYEKEYKTTTLSEPAKWSFKSCDANNPKQQFLANKINTKDMYNSFIKDPKNQNKILKDNSNILFGFNIINPITANDQCLQLNNDGLTVMPCDLNYSQRFREFYNTVLQ